MTYLKRTLIFARHLFSRVHIFAVYMFAPEALGINFRYVSIFAWLLFSFFLQKSIGSNFCACLHARKYSQKFDMLVCIHTKWASLFSRVVIFAFFLGSKITTARKLMSLRYPILSYLILSLNNVLE